MASRIIKKFKPVEFFFLFLVFVVFILVLGKYLYPPLVNYVNVVKAQEVLSVKIMPIKTCPQGQVEIQLDGGILCRDQIASSTYLTIFDTYTLNPEGKEQIFPFINANDASETILVANDYLDNEYYVDRYAPVEMNTLTWNEDPYNQQYWRFIFYSLRDEEYLLQAWQETGNQAYKDKFIAIVQSFLTTGTNQPLAWDNPHTVAFRTMVLVDAWWELREYNALSVELSNQILQSLEQHGTYLADPNNYQAESNHGVNETSALFLLSKDFPDLPNAASWQVLSESRLSTGLNTVVDSDGVLVENSPYYHFYTLEKYWQIFQWARTQGLVFDPSVQAKIQKMIDYATYILQPDDTIPLWGASLERTINFSGVDKEIAVANPNFLYVLTHGEQGIQPPQLSVHYDSAGQTIMRSGWGTGENFTQQTQVIFNVGPYRTNHSQLDALAFTLYSQGLALMPGPGLYTYTSSTYRDYFQGTASHNTVVVDGEDQNVGAAVAGTFEEGDGYTYQTGESSLYAGVTHDRAVVLLGQDLVLIVDSLKSSTQHSYQQTFHLFPGATLEENGLDITGYNGSPSSNQQITIHQLLTAGVTVTSTISNPDPIGGVCSESYGVLIPCYQIGYDQTGENANFVTLLEIGKSNPNLQARLSSDQQTVTITDGDKDYTINIGDVAADTTPVEITNNTLSMATTTEIIPNSVAILQSPITGETAQIKEDLPLDLSNKNLGLEINIPNAANVKNLAMVLSTNNGSGYATIRLSDLYPAIDSGQNIDIILGKGELRNEGGNWTIGGNGFDWSDIDAVTFKMQSVLGKTATLHVNDISLVAPQSQGSVVIVFDGGSSSILPAAEIMQNMGFQGNVGAVSEYIAGDRAGYLGVPQLQNLQNTYGWDILNESWSNSNEVSTYYTTSNLNGLSQDILQGAEYLSDSNINSDPNWFIYPDGATNPAIQSIVSEYYKFAQTTESMPTVYPFGNPLAVTAFPTITPATPPQNVMKAVYDAKKYNLTLILNFNKIQFSASDTNGYSLANFQEIMEYIAQQNIAVKTFTELDQSNSVNIDGMKFAQDNPEQIGLQVAVKNNLFEELSGLISLKF